MRFNRTFVERPTAQLPPPMNILERGPDGATLHVHSADAVLGEHPLGNVATVQTLFSVDGRFLLA